MNIAIITKAIMERMAQQRFLPALAMLAVMVLLTAIMAGLLAATLFYEIYVILIQQGFQPEIALHMIVLSIAVVTAILIFCVVRRARKLCREMQPLSPLTSGIQEIAKAFMEGLKEPVKLT